LEYHGIEEVFPDSRDWWVPFEQVCLHDALEWIVGDWQCLGAHGKVVENRFLEEILA